MFVLLQEIEIKVIKALELIQPESVCSYQVQISESFSKVGQIKNKNHSMNQHKIVHNYMVFKVIYK